MTSARYCCWFSRGEHHGYAKGWYICRRSKVDGEGEPKARPIGARIATSYRRGHDRAMRIVRTLNTGSTMDRERTLRELTR